jgi:hypothetical protein
MTITEYEHLRDENRKLRQDNERLREALAWYASERTWNQWLPDSAGDIARKALLDGKTKACA